MSYLILILGVALWSGVHLFKRVAPERRAALGDKAKGPIAILIVLSIVLMVIGYRGTEGGFLWGRSTALVGINNLLMLLAVYLFSVGRMGVAVSRYIRHPQLTGVKAWSLAHLVVNGDLASFILFGGLLAWAVAEVVLINRAEGRDWVRPEPAPLKTEVIGVVSTLVAFAIFGFVHGWLGYPAFG